MTRGPGLYVWGDGEHEVALCMALLTEEYGGDACKYWNKALV